ncbi:MAG: carbohydrate porin, partial [Chthoniobacterales bacterium]
MKNKNTDKKPVLGRRSAFVATILLAIPTLGFAGTTTTTVKTETSKSPLEQWWNGKYATGTWFGGRNILEDHGVTLSGEWKANLLWNVDGGLQQRFGYDDEWKFRVLLDFAKLTGWETIEGLSAYSDVRYRGGAGVNKWVGASNNFAPSTFQGGRLWLFQNAYLSYVTPKLFGIKEFLTLSGGWQNPTDIFINQPLSKFFLNNTFTSGKGLSTNGIPWGGSYAAWGGYLKVKPVDWYYAQAGLYLAIPGGTNTADHGLDFAGNQINPDSNGLYFIGETGFTPKIGPSKLPGKYAAGVIYWGVENTSFYGEKYDQRNEVYFQADQQIYREPSRRAIVKAPSAGKSGKEVVTAPKLSEQGLYFFSLFNVAPAFNNTLPFYFQTGLVYKGLIPTRDSDQVGVALAYGSYSSNLQQSQADSGKPVQTYEGVLEFDYRVQINKWAYVQPNLQYIIRPNGNGLT